MFGKLKEKLKNWTKGLTKKAEETEEIDVDEIEKTKNQTLADAVTSRKEKKSSKKNKKEKKKEEESEIELPELEKTETISELIEESEETLSRENIRETPKKEVIISQQTSTSDSPTASLEGKSVRENREVVFSDEQIGDGKATEQKKSFFSKFTSKINKVTFTEKEFWEYAEELEMLLLENNVAFEVADKIIEKLKERLVGKEFLKKEIEGLVQDSLKDIIYEILVEPFDLIEKIKLKAGEEKPFVILFCGINGTGKTTTIAKIIHLLKKNKLTSVIAAGDTFRAASIEQLNKHGEKLGVKVISHEYGSDPASVGFDAIKYAEKNKINVVLIDTAGRMHTEKNLMAQIEKVAKVTNPDTRIFVGEAITGNDIVEQVQEFNKSVKIDGIILSKADVDEKGGTALSVGYTTGKPILFLGTGQNYEDLEKFDRNKFVEKLGL